MSKLVSRSSSVLRLAAVSMAFAAVFGCDDRTSGDKASLEKVQAGLAKVAALDGLKGDELKPAIDQIGAAAAAPGAGPGYQALASGALASVHEQAAYVGTLALNEKEAEVRRTLAALNRLAGQVTTSAGYASAYALSDPKAAIADLSSHISSMQGNAQNLTWGPDDKSQLPTQAAVKQESARLDGEITEREQQLATMTKQRSEAIATADQQDAHAGQIKGDESVKAFADASESRRKADDLAINIDLVQDQLKRLKSDAAIQQGQAAALVAGVKSLQGQGTDIEKDWGNLQKHAGVQTKVATVALEGDEQSKVSIKSALADLGKQMAALVEQRSMVMDHLSEGEKAARDAREAANKFAQTFSAKMTQAGKEADTYKALRNVVLAQQYEYLLGSILRDTGALETSQAQLLTDVKTTLDGMKAAVTAAGLSAPAEADAIDVSAIKPLTDDAETRLTDAAASLVNVESGDSPEKLRNAAKVARLVTLQGHLRLYDYRIANGDTAAKTSSTALYSDALALKGELTAAGVPLPPLPGELGTPTPPATPAT